jgi:hypothetical protein
MSGAVETVASLGQILAKKTHKFKKSENGLFLIGRGKNAGTRARVAWTRWCFKTREDFHVESLCAAVVETGSMLLLVGDRTLASYRLATGVRGSSGEVPSLRNVDR